MAFQLVFVVESDEKSKSDYIYIRSILEEDYHISKLKDVKISAVFMGGKGNYQKKNVLNKIVALRKGYQKIGDTYVLYCFDTDKYDSDPNDGKVLEEEQQYCKKNGYEFIWFCHDIEEVFLGSSVAADEKVERAKQYSRQNQIKNVKRECLKSERMTKGKSNLLTVLKRCFDS